MWNNDEQVGINYEVLYLITTQFISIKHQKYENNPFLLPAKQRQLAKEQCFLFLSSSGDTFVREHCKSFCTAVLLFCVAQLCCCFSSVGTLRFASHATFDCFSELLRFESRNLCFSKGIGTSQRENGHNSALS